MVVGDTSALISLAVGQVLEPSLELSDIIIPNKVHFELKEMARFKDMAGIGAKGTLNLISKDMIKVCGVKDDGSVERLITKYSRIDQGEAEALVLAQERSISILITDDLRCLPDLKKAAKGVEIHLSVYLLSRLVFEKKIPLRKAELALDRIAKERTWESAAIYSLAKEYLRNGLK